MNPKLRFPLEMHRRPAAAPLRAAGGRTALLLSGLWILGSGFSSSADDPNPTIEPLGTSSWRFDWTGAAGRTYFIQWSDDLLDWHYFPVMDQGPSHDPFEFSTSADRFFIRLRHTDDPDPDQDFDGDGLSGLFEVMHGYDPFEEDTDGNGTLDGAEDEDQDGSLNLSEQFTGRNPKVKDHPAVKLSVVAGN